MRQQVEVNYDTHQEVKNIQGAGFDLKQAEVIVRSINASRNNDISKLATKEQIFVLEKTMDVMAGDISSLKSDVKELSTDVAILKSDVAILKSNVNSLQKDIKTLDDKVTGQIKALDDKLSAQIKALDDKFTAKFIELEAKIDLKIENLGNQLRAEFKEFAQVVLRWLAGLFLTLLGILAMLAFRFFIH